MQRKLTSINEIIHNFQCTSVNAIVMFIEYDILLRSVRYDVDIPFFLQ